ncbi:MAG: Low conductance mechanosensitive channel YnaI, partial [Betaproteobacteria bacterium]|nr:Low conductance mechanosensitive channel YnaI [Betaproteobacteria bacterium]
ELVKAGWGILFIRILCIALFRIAMPALGAGQPRILHEIVFVLAVIGWCLVRLRMAGLELGGIITTSAAITAIVAFSMQETLGNILGGLALQLDKSLHLGDWIAVENVRGKVVEVRWRHTALLTPNGEVVVIPNSLLMKSKMTVVSSAEYPMARRTVRFSTPNQVPPHEVIAVVEKALRDAVMTHVAAAPAPDCVICDYEGGTISFAVRYWLLDQLHDAAVDSTVRLHIYSALRRNEFSLARPVLDVRMDAEAEARKDDLRNQEIERRIKVLGGVALFAGLQPDELRTVAAGARVTPFVKGDVITRQGAVAHWLYVLVSGEADIWYEGADGERRFVSTLSPGTVFGEMGMMTGAPRSATVSARSHALCYRIDKENFEGVLRARPQLAGQLASVMAERNSALEAVRAEHNANQPETDDASLAARIRRFFMLG